MKVIVNNNNVSTRHKEVEEKQIISDVWTHFSAGHGVGAVTACYECYKNLHPCQLLTYVRLMWAKKSSQVRGIAPSFSQRLVQ